MGSRCACAANHYVIAVKCPFLSVQMSTSSATVGLTSEKVVLYNMAAEQGAISKQLFYTLKLRCVGRWIVEFILKTYGAATISAILTDLG